MVLKILLGLVAVLLALVAAYVLNMKYFANPRVIDELRNNPDGERAARVTLLIFEDGRQIPVNYLHEGDKVFIGADGPWWRAFRDGGAPVSVLIRGETLEGHARTVLDDPGYTKEVFERLRPTVPKWLPDWLNGKLVVVTLS